MSNPSSFETNKFAAVGLRSRARDLIIKLEKEIFKLQINGYLVKSLKIQFTIHNRIKQ